MDPTFEMKYVPAILLGGALFIKEKNYTVLRITTVCNCTCVVQHCAVMQYVVLYCVVLYSTGTGV